MAAKNAKTEAALVDLIFEGTPKPVDFQVGWGREEPSMVLKEGLLHLVAGATEKGKATLIPAVSGRAIASGSFTEDDKLQIQISSLQSLTGMERLDRIDSLAGQFRMERGGFSSPSGAIKSLGNCVAELEELERLQVVDRLLSKLDASHEDKSVDEQQIAAIQILDPTFRKLSAAQTANYLDRLATIAARFPPIGRGIFFRGKTHVAQSLGDWLVQLHPEIEGAWNDAKAKASAPV